MQVLGKNTYGTCIQPVTLRQIISAQIWT
uniref:Uncharacterized protein n=1 Tax=Arundo donax TaxID=35708 RepID=A0A0A8ZVI9_ARUDO